MHQEEFIYRPEKSEGVTASCYHLAFIEQAGLLQTYRQLSQRHDTANARHKAWRLFTVAINACYPFFDTKWVFSQIH